MRSTHSLFYGASSASLAGNSLYLLVDRFVCWRVSQYVTSLYTASFMPVQYKFWQIIASVRSSPG